MPKPTEGWLQYSKRGGHSMGVTEGSSCTPNQRAPVIDRLPIVGALASGEHDEDTLEFIADAAAVDGALYANMRDRLRGLAFYQALSANDQLALEEQLELGRKKLLRLVLIAALNAVRDNRGLPQTVAPGWMGIRKRIDEMRGVSPVYQTNASGSSSNDSRGRRPRRRSPNGKRRNRQPIGQYDLD